MTTIKANVANIAASKKNIEGYRKENSFYQEIAAIDPKTGRAVVTARFYGPGSTAYCVVWVAGAVVCAHGMGKAGGYGYHRPSAALQGALDDMGVKLSSPISGRGSGLMDCAVEAVAQAITGKRKFIIHRAHA